MIKKRVINVDKPEEMAEAHVALFGDNRCGKTALVNKFAHDTFDEKYQQTVVVGYEFCMDLDKPRPTSVALYDFVGNKSFNELRADLNRDLTVALFCFDNSNPASLDGLEFWKKELDSYPKKLKQYLVCCKSDQPRAPAIDKTLPGWLKSKNLRLFETSAKTGAGMEALLKELVDSAVAPSKR